MADQVERFSHGTDGLWLDPDGPYVEYTDYEKLERERDQIERELRLESDLRIAEAADRDEVRKQRDEELRGRIEEFINRTHLIKVVREELRAIFEEAEGG
jgi:hypothetical protein